MEYVNRDDLLERLEWYSIEHELKGFTPYFCLYVATKRPHGVTGWRSLAFYNLESKQFFLLADIYVGNNFHQINNLLRDVCNEFGLRHMTV